MADNQTQPTKEDIMHAHYYKFLNRLKSSQYVVLQMGRVIRELGTDATSDIGIFYALSWDTKKRLIVERCTKLMTDNKGTMRMEAMVPFPHRQIAATFNDDADRNLHEIMQSAENLGGLVYILCELEAYGKLYPELAQITALDFWADVLENVADMANERDEFQIIYQVMHKAECAQRHNQENFKVEVFNTFWRGWIQYYVHEYRHENPDDADENIEKTVCEHILREYTLLMDNKGIAFPRLVKAVVRKPTKADHVFAMVIWEKEMLDPTVIVPIIESLTTFEES